MDPMIINDDTRGLDLLRQSPSAPPQFRSGGDADGDSDSLREQNAEVHS